MDKRANFDTHWGPGWPDARTLEPYFLGGRDKRWVFEHGGDSGSFIAEGTDGTEHLQFGQVPIHLHLFVWGNPSLGVLLMYHKWGGPRRDSYNSKGDLTRLDQYYQSADGQVLPIGLFIPFEDAWRAVKEFVETDGALPKCIEWIAERDLPSDAFPDLDPSVLQHYRSRIVLKYRAHRAGLQG
jgi:hypothetical protein